MSCLRTSTGMWLDTVGSRMLDWMDPWSYHSAVAKLSLCSGVTDGKRIGDISEGQKAHLQAPDPQLATYYTAQKVPVKSAMVQPHSCFF